ncbi:hypothetical protein [Ramlibacter sp. AN1133]|uniref:hypothetical protein n=1 Tax=Ramlibacter sp. AN1133 TaxID=3133429 RepID=UPI0030BDE49B
MNRTAFFLVSALWIAVVAACATRGEVRGAARGEITGAAAEDSGPSWHACSPAGSPGLLAAAGQVLSD